MEENLRQRATKKLLRVTLPDGKVICHKSVLQWLSLSSFIILLISFMFLQLGVFSDFSVLCTRTSENSNVYKIA